MFLRSHEVVFRVIWQRNMMQSCYLFFVIYLFIYYFIYRSYDMHKKCHMTWRCTCEQRRRPRCLYYQRFEEKKKNPPLQAEFKLEGLQEAVANITLEMGKLQTKKLQKWWQLSGVVAMERNLASFRRSTATCFFEWPKVREANILFVA